MPRGLIPAILVAMLTSTACAPAFTGRWDGSGEIGEAGYFSFSLDFVKGPGSGEFRTDKSDVVAGPVCQVVRRDRHVEFVIASRSGSADCASLSYPLTFVGDFGQDVVTGSVLERKTDGGERLVGVFRAFRVRKEK
ncbi:MAG TPA: hypothetical protein PLC24_06760 [Myxococcota bacterium]|nr:hypothetical protein [Myxococcota bacterium]HPV04248.1 hypothetical protein [Myxococcota bacterium]